MQGNQLIQVDGYKAFRGVLRVTPSFPGYAPFEVEGDCLYKPDTDCWIVQPTRGLSEAYPADICEAVPGEALFQRSESR